MHFSLLFKQLQLKEKVCISILHTVLVHQRKLPLADGQAISNDIWQSHSTTRWVQP